MTEYFNCVCTKETPVSQMFECVVNNICQGREN